MNKRWVYFLVGGGAVVAGVVALVLVLALALALGVFQLGRDADAASAPVAAAALLATSDPASQPPGGPAEGIKVHGRWTIDVREPDGQLVSHTDFENALTSTGATTLAGFLAHRNTVGLWAVSVIGSPAPCVSSVPNPSNCYSYEPAYGPSGPNVFKTLQVDVPASGVNANKLVLTGTVTAANSTSISQVWTYVFACPPTATADSNCVGTSIPFTQATLGSAVAVSAGQQIALTVVISFS